MGIFGEMRAMGGLLKDMVNMGIADFKACDQMEKLIEEARSHLTEPGFLTPANIRCIKDYDAAKKANDYENTKDLESEERTKRSDAEEQKQVACMKSFQLNRKFSDEFRNSCKEAIELYNKAFSDDAMYSSMETNMMKMYKFSPEEKEIVHKMFAESQKYGKATDQMDELIAEAKGKKTIAGFLTAADKAIISRVDTAKTENDKASEKSGKKAQAEQKACLKALDNARRESMNVFQKNMKFSPQFRTKCKNAAALYDTAEEAMDKLAEYEK